MEDTRVQILADIEAWANDPSAPKVYCLNGLLGAGKTSIAHTFCRRLDAQEKLGASFFCSRSGLMDATRIIPTVANMLAQYNPNFRSAIIDVLASTPDVTDFNSLSEQFTSLIINPLKPVTEHKAKSVIIVIDALDECSAPKMVEILINTILDGVAGILLKFFITSRPESHIRKAFHCQSAHSNVFTEVSLQEATRDDIRKDIHTYLHNSLSEISSKDLFSQGSPEWPPTDEFSVLLNLSADLFIYAATAIRYIRENDEDNKDRLTEITRLSSSHTPPFHTQAIDLFYKHIIDRAFSHTVGRGRSNRTDVLATVVCLQTPLSMNGIASLLHLDIRDIQIALSPLQLVIHVSDNGLINIFHASFREFIIDPERCPGNIVEYSKTHEMLTAKCLQFLNMSLRRNICGLPEGRIGTLPHDIRDSSVISEALRYSSLHWASHLQKALSSPGDTVQSTVLHQLCTFADEHILHWFECLSAVGELETGVKSLSTAKEAISVSTSYVEVF